MGPMRRVMVGFEAPNAPVEAAWARLRYPTSTQAKFANGSLEGDGRSTRVDLAAALRLLDQNGQSDLAAGFFAARHPHHRDLFYAADHGVFWEEALPSDFQLYSVETGELVTEPGRASRAVWKSTSASGATYRHAVEQASRRWRGGRRARAVKF